jgi:hypothetical protein
MKPVEGSFLIENKLEGYQKVISFIKQGTLVFDSALSPLEQARVVAQDALNVAREHVAAHPQEKGDVLKENALKHALKGIEQQIQSGLLTRGAKFIAGGQSTEDKVTVQKQYRDFIKGARDHDTASESEEDEKRLSMGSDTSSKSN